MPVDKLTVDNEGESWVYCHEVEDDEDQSYMDFLENLIES